jgi:cellulose synthase/poly-beta-1,6-N-acetylglucosamine synthase-like glycosyltransferase
VQELTPDKKRVTVGIPSYNEEMNISNLLRSIIELNKLDNQPESTNNDNSCEKDEYYNSGTREDNRMIAAKDFAICEIIISDDSSDNTYRLVETLATENPSLSIKLLHHDNRRGVPSAWNEIFKEAIGEIIVLYDADIIISNSTTANLVQSISNGIGLCASNSQPLVLKESAVSRASVFIAEWLRWVRKSGLSQYTVMGRALSILSQVAKRITIPEGVIALDLYLQCKVVELGFKVVYNDQALVYFRPPDNMKDFSSQIIRATNGHKQIRHLLTGRCIGLPLRNRLVASVKSIVQDPKGVIYLIYCYSLLPFYGRNLTATDSSKWDIAKSTKRLT